MVHFLQVLDVPFYEEDLADGHGLLLGTGRSLNKLGQTMANISILLYYQYQNSREMNTSFQLLRKAASC